MLSESLKSTWTDKVSSTVFFKFNIDDVSRIRFDTAYFLMSEKRRKKCDALRREDDKKLCILSDMKTREILSEITGLSYEELEFDTEEAGKPYLKNADCHFSISHSEKMVAVAVNKKKPVGIDIEKIRPVSARIAKRVFSLSDIRYVFQSDNVPDGEILDIEMQERFFRVWTYKEAFVKMTGQGIDDDIKNISYNAENCVCELSDDYCITVVTKE